MRQHVVRGVVRLPCDGNASATKMTFVYTVWFADLALLSEDPDYEWPACFVIDGESEASTKKWGDHLADRYARSHGQRVIESRAEPQEVVALPGVDDLPLVREGYEATDDEIGW